MDDIWKFRLKWKCEIFSIFVAKPFKNISKHTLNAKTRLTTWKILYFYFLITQIFLDFLSNAKNMLCQICLGNNVPQDTPSKPNAFFPLAFTGKYFCAFLHDLSFRATLHKVNFENKVKTIIEAKASKESEETRWMICIHLVPSSYEICKGFPCF